MVKKIAIRVDTNEKIATGHVQRCMVVANSIIRMGAEAVLVSADEGVVPFAHGHKIRVHVLGTDWSDMRSEIDVLIEYLRSEGIVAMLVDSYSVTVGYFDRLRKAGIRVAYMDDLCEKAYPVDAVINYCPAAISMGYERLYGQNPTVGDFNCSAEAPDGTELYLGSAYIPIREQFIKHRIETDRDESDNSGPYKGILVTTGGSDSLGLTEIIVRSIVDTPGFDKVHILAGRYYNPSEYILNAVESGRVLLHQNVSDVAYVMSLCRVAVSSAGSTLYELSAMGIPTITFTIADNQMSNARFFAGISSDGDPAAAGAGTALQSEACLMPYAGDFRTNCDGCLRKITAFLQEISAMTDEEPDERSSMLRSLVDGHGADRIAEVLLTL
ncbi:MAG: hypothetical protein IJ058_12840 [Lachnospiraceae bacterium]|nr:hypothetical protein [Lachnospiraceae bacterium]